MAKLYFYNKDRTIVLTVDSEGMEAHLLLEEGIPFYNEADITALLQQAGITAGIEEARSEAQKHDFVKSRGKPFLIAAGVPVTLPRTNLRFLIAEPLIEKNRLFAESITIADLQGMAKTAKESPIASLESTEVGRDGFDIFGNHLPFPENRKELGDLYSGANVSYDFENNLFISQADGYIYFDDDNKLAVKNTTEIRGDCRLDRLASNDDKEQDSSDESDFEIYGNLIIHGNLIGKGSLRVKGELLVNGDTQSCTLFVEGKTHCTASINNSALISLNSVETNAVVSSRVCTGFQLIIHSSAEDSLLIAEVNVLADSENSFCHNCQIHSGKQIKLNNCSLSHEAGSGLTIGIAPFTRELIAFLQKDLEIESGLSSQGKERFSAKQKELTDLQDHLLKRYSNIEYTGSMIEVVRKVEKGTYLRILKHQRTLDKDMEGVSYYIENDKLITNRRSYYP